MMWTGDKKKPLQASELAGLWKGKLSTNLPLKIANYTLEIGLVENRLLLRRAEEESGTAKIVDPAGHVSWPKSTSVLKPGPMD
jgi:hypothetical protein